MTFPAKQIPDSSWAKFRGLGKLPREAPAAVTIASVWVARRLRYEWLCFANVVLSRLIT